MRIFSFTFTIILILIFTLIPLLPHLYIHIYINKILRKGSIEFHLMEMAAKVMSLSGCCLAILLITNRFYICSSQRSWSWGEWRKPFSSIGWMISYFINYKFTFYTFEILHFRWSIIHLTLYAGLVSPSYPTLPLKSIWIACKKILGSILHHPNRIESAFRIEIAVIFWPFGFCFVSNNFPNT